MTIRSTNDSLKQPKNIVYAQASLKAPFSISNNEVGESARPPTFTWTFHLHMHKPPPEKLKDPRHSLVQQRVSVYEKLASFLFLNLLQTVLSTIDTPLFQSIETLVLQQVSDTIGLCGDATACVLEVIEVVVYDG